ncbi:Equisetin cluster transcription factor eqxF [Colletotrichum trifolii]|uniref:Equisetin cluster transcription factor eqxF n=1 Tax=Colletotrichum trifolii TaxID=5466 RepID=A0A4R8QPC3_COLTR|nr:Equisetin cluster transcription factor eqxF [Colletotrichum trifolii]
MTLEPQRKASIDTSEQLGQQKAVETAVDDRSETGSMWVKASEHHYVGGDHWAAILDSIADLKDHFEREEQFQLATSPEHMTDGVYGVEHEAMSSRRALLLYGCRPAASRAEILSALPPKEAVDRYVSRYFNRLDLVAPSSVHGPTFLREYEDFWVDSSGPTIMWIGLLYSMLCLAVIASDVTEGIFNTDIDQQALQIDLYREKVVQCLMMGSYTQGGAHVLETLLNYVYIEFRIHEDAEKDVWFILGIEINLAKRMGYHRDPKHFPNITPLEGEMRRRVWATVLLSDALISGQMGMPRMIANTEFDTAEPRNLNDSDLDANTKELPPARPETEHTTTLGIIARRRLLMALGEISDLTSSLKPCNYSDMMRVDATLHKARLSIPPPLQPQSMAANVTDSPQTIMARLFLGHIFYKGQLTLHRRFLFTPSTSVEADSFAYSRKTCLDAALATLTIQKVLDEEIRPGGQLQTMHWRVGSIMNHHFLTATMVLCAMIYRKQTLGHDDDILKALRTARAIWMRKGESSKEALKAAQAVNGNVQVMKFLMAKLDIWDDFSDVVHGETAPPDHEQGTVVAVFRAVLALYLHPAFHEVLHEHVDLLQEIQRRSDSAPGEVSVAAHALGLMWTDPDPRAFGPRELHIAMKKQVLGFGMG